MFGVSLDVRPSNTSKLEFVPGKKDTSSPLFRPHDGDSLVARLKVLQ